MRLDPSLPGAHFARAEALLLRGDWAEGWEEYEWRFRIRSAAPLIPPAAMLPTPMQQWDGRPMPDKTLLLIADQGFGDVVQFCRYIPWAAQSCPHIAIVCAKEMSPLLRQQHPRVALIEHWNDCPPYCGLLRAVGVAAAARHAARQRAGGDRRICARTQQRSAVWRERLDRLAPPGYRRVGLVWAGRSEHNNDRNRSTALATFAPLGALPGIALVSLQKGPATAQAGNYFGRAPLLNIGAEVADYEDTMAILDCLDIVVTVDTSVGHLAGAMDRPAAIMLPRTPDWRWLLDRADSPWYKSVRLFRQSISRQWDEPVAGIAAHLQRQFR